MPVNIKQVAKSAGVSSMTVSRYLNNPSLLAPETQRKVGEAIRKLGYTPNEVARSLKANRTNILGLITVDLTDHFFTQVSAGAEEEARKRGYRIMVGSTERDPVRESEYLQLFARQQVDGIILVRDSDHSEIGPLLQYSRTGIPLAATGPLNINLPFPIIEIDNVDGGYKAVRLLLENGHHRIATITGPMTHRSCKDRLKGYQKALLECGILFDEDIVFHADSWGSRSGKTAMQQLLARKVKFTAVFIQSDELAFGAMSVLRQNGYRIPEDISIVGYDNLPLAEYSDPPLTTIHQPSREIGRMAVQTLIHQIEEGKRLTQIVSLMTELVERNSVEKCHRNIGESALSLMRETSDPVIY